MMQDGGRKKHDDIILNYKNLITDSSSATPKTPK